MAGLRPALVLRLGVVLGLLVSLVSPVAVTPAPVASAQAADGATLSILAHPVEVAVYHLNGAGTHNFWVDESRGILYAAYYNAGIVALDVTGTLSGDLASREIARLTVGGSDDTYTWGVMLANGSLWVTDMLSGLWKVNVP